MPPLSGQIAATVHKNIRRAFLEASTSNILHSVRQSNNNAFPEPMMLGSLYAALSGI